MEIVEQAKGCVGKSLLMKKKIASNFKNPFEDILFLIAMMSITYYMYGTYRKSTFTIDDPISLSLFVGTEKNIFDAAFGSAYYGRYRPFASAIFYICGLVFKYEYSQWFVFLGICLVLYSYAVVVLCRNFGASKSLSYVAGLLVLSSRLAQGLVFNITFLLEVICNFLLLLLIYLIGKHYKDGNVLYLYSGVMVLYFLILSHERYIGLILFLGVYLLLSNKFDWKKKFGIFGLITIPIIIFVISKSHIFNIPIFVGTGSTTDIGFSYATSLQHIVLVFLNLLSINIGQSYLVGQNFQMQSPIDQSLSLFIGVLTVIALATILKRCIKFELKYRNFAPILIIGSFFISLVVPVVVTIRLEQRWIFPSYSTMIIIFAVFLTKIMKEIPDVKFKYRFSTHSLVIFFLIASLYSNFSFIKTVDLIYFRSQQIVYEENMASLAKLQKAFPTPSHIILLAENGENPNFFQIKQSLVDTYGQVAKTLEVMVSKNGIPGDNKDLFVFQIRDNKLDLLPYGLAKKRFYYSQQFYSDGWMGERAVLQVDYQECSRVALEFSPISIPLEVSITDELLQKRTIDLSRELKSLLTVSKENSEFTLNFSRTFQPKVLGINEDLRFLSANVVTTCLND